MIRSRLVFRLLGILLLLGGFIGVNVYILSHTTLFDHLEHVGLLGLLVLSIMSGFNVVVPIPVAVLYPSFEAIGYAPWVIIGTMSVGMLLGDSVGFVLGRAGKQVLPETVIARRFIAFTEVYPKMMMFAVCLYGMAVPLPNELMVIPLAMLGVPWYKVLLPLLVGNIVFTTIIAHGADGITSLFL